MKSCDCSPNYCCCGPEEIVYQNFIAPKLYASFKITEPKGIFEVAKQVKLVVGEGDSKIEVGKADLEKLPNGDAMVYLTITNSAIIEALGGSELKGIMATFVENEEVEKEEPSE